MEYTTVACAHDVEFLASTLEDAMVRMARHETRFDDNGVMVI